MLKQEARTVGTELFCIITSGLTLCADEFILISSSRKNSMVLWSWLHPFWRIEFCRCMHLWWMGKIIVLKAKKGIFLTELKELQWAVLWVGKKGEWFLRAPSILVVDNPKVLCSWMITSDISRKIYLFISVFFFFSGLSTLFFLLKSSLNFRIAFIHLFENFSTYSL